MNASVSLYLHIPFCRHRCAYCDFNTYTGLSVLQTPYAAGLATEVGQVATAGPRGLSVETIFFGGGTPSLMSPADLDQILQSVRGHFEVAPEAEITMEANPGTVNGAYLDDVRALGVNRLSFGMQSAVAGELSLLEREHDLQTVIDAVRLSRAAGFDNVSLDLIYGLPGQTLDSWETSLQAALDMETEHLSLYCLTIEAGTPMQRWLEKGTIKAPDPDLAAEQYALACRRLAEDGWEHYEISNWARPGRLCAHNLCYWRNGEYLGLGAGAHGHAGGYRYRVVKQPRTYLRRLREGNGHEYPLSSAVDEAHAVTEAEAITDTLITGLRLLQEGIDVAAFEEQFGRSVRQIYGETLDQLLAWELLEEKRGRLLLSERGWFLSNQVFYRLLLAEDEVDVPAPAHP